MTYISWAIAICWAAFILYWIISSFGIKRDIGKTPWQRLWWIRVIFAFAIIGWLWGTSRWGKLVNHKLTFSSHATGILGLIGVVLCVGGIALAVWARVHLGRNWSPVPSLKEGHELITSGPYSLIRHPIYTGTILALFGSALTSPAWFVIFILISIMFVWRIYVEESLMMRQFPNLYPNYEKRTWALVPYIW